MKFDYQKCPPNTFLKICLDVLKFLDHPLPFGGDSEGFLDTPVRGRQKTLLPPKTRQRDFMCLRLKTVIHFFGFPKFPAEATKGGEVYQGRHYLQSTWLQN